jgi:hypothetical protein
VGSCEVLALGKVNIVMKSRTTTGKRNILTSQSDAIGCHGLVPWSLTLAAKEKKPQNSSAEYF